MLRLRAAVSVDPVAYVRAGTTVETVAHAVMVFVGLAAPTVDRAALRRVDAVVDAIEDAVLVHVDRGPAEAWRVGVAVIVGVGAAGSGHQRATGEREEG